MRLTEVCIRKPVFAWMLMAATVVFGGVAASRIGISQFPDVDFPTINISATYEGASPDVIEKEVLEPIEQEVIQVEGVKSITSSARMGSGSVTVELDLSRDVDAALQDVQTRVARARLPRDMNLPSVSKNNPEDQPIMWIGLSGPFSRQLLADTARYRVAERLQTIEGVGELMLGGYLDRNIRIWIDAEKLAEKGLTVAELIAALQREHVELPAGQLETEGRELNVRVLGEAFDLETLRGIVIREVGGAPITIDQVAFIEDGFEDVRRMARTEGNPVQGMGVKKKRGSNAVSVARAVRAELVKINASLPDGMQARIIFDSTRYIEQSVHHIELELLLAVALTALVCWMFLGSLSSTLNVVLAIPMSLLGTVAVIYFLGFTLNTFTLLGLSLAVGIVVDDAIMVMENIFRHAEGGKDRVTAAREGTQEITFAALAATIAVIAIFLPVIFMEGVVGKFFFQFGVTLAVAVMLSYLEAITLAPARCAQLLRASRHDRSAVGRLVDRGFERLARGYAWLLERSLRRPLLVVIAGALVFVGSLQILKQIPSEFVPSQDQSRLMVRIQTAPGSDLDETNRLFTRAETYVNARPEVERAMMIIGGFGGGGVNTGVMMITLVPREQRDLTQVQFQQQLRGALNGIPGVRAVVQDLSQSGFTAQRGFPVEFSVRGPNWEELIVRSQELREKLQDTGLVVDLDTDYQIGMPELRVLPDRARAADLGVSMEGLGTTINALVGGIRVGKYSSDGRRVDVRARLIAAQRTRPEDISALRVRTASGELVPLSALVKLEERPALQSITRRDRERAITVYGNVAPGHSQQEVLAAVEGLGKQLPPGYRVVLGGASVAFQESMGGLYFALLLGIIVAYMVLASQFNSFLHPITVLTILPLSIAGAAAALYLTGKTLNIFSMIGILLLLGIVKKNSIILVDYATSRRAGGLDARQAMLEAGPVRLRPILMTSVATLMAAVPAALALGLGSETRSPMAIAVIGGLTVSTLLSLLVVPAFYVLADRIRTRVFGWFGSGKLDAGENAPAPRVD